MKSNQTQAISLAIGAAFALATLSPVASAADNPFGMQKLDGGYQLAQADMKKMEDKKKDGKCGEGKCGAEKKKAEKMNDKMGDKKKDGSCGGDKQKDGSCGGDKKK